MRWLNADKERKKIYVHPEPIELVYEWGGARKMGLRPYLLFWRINVASSQEAQRFSVFLCAEGRRFIQQHLVRKNPPDHLKAWYKEFNLACDEVYPPPSAFPSRLPTHLIEVGVEGRGKARSPFFKSALCLLNAQRDSDYAAISIGGYIAWELSRWNDYNGAALDNSQILMMQYLLAKWRGLR